MSPRGYLLSLSIVLLGLCATLVLGCGGSPHRLLQSINVSPSSADAEGYPNGEVPFVATGTYNTSPRTVTPLQAGWGTGNLDGSPTTEISVDANGVAQCLPGAAGAYLVGAWAAQYPPGGNNCTVIGPFSEPACGGYVLGTAQLTCP